LDELWNDRLNVLQHRAERSDDAHRTRRRRGA
jgi:hypothetical protein